MDPTLVPGTRFESQFQICVYEHAILRIYISFFSNIYYLNTTCALTHLGNLIFIYTFRTYQVFGVV